MDTFDTVESGLSSSVEIDSEVSESSETVVRTPVMIAAEAEK